MKLKYAIVGTGALGGFYGGKLAHAGCDVHFLCNSDYAYVKENGLRIDSVNGNFVLNPVNVYNKTTQMPPCDVVLVCLKTTNNHLLKDLLPPLLHKDTLVVLVQNGLGIEKELAADFPEQPIAGGMAFICSSKLGDGHIAHFDYGNIRIGLFQGQSHKLLEQMSADFKPAGIKIEIVPDLNVSRWQKLVWNIPYNGMTVALNTTTDKMMQQPDARKLIWDLMMEVIEASCACGAGLTEEFAHKMMLMTDKMTPYAPSMKLDFDSRRTMEIQAIYRNPINTALDAGYYMKKVSMLEQQLSFIQSTF